MLLHNISIACTRPSVVFGYGRKRSSLMWAEEFATNPALGKSVHLPFPETNKDNYVYVEDCAEQFIELSLKEKLNHFVYNTGSETVSGMELKKIILELIPDAEITFDENGKPTPFIDDQDDQRSRQRRCTPSAARARCAPSHAPTLHSGPLRPGRHQQLPRTHVPRRRTRTST